MKKISTVQAYGKEILKEQKLTIGVDLGDRWSFYCVLDEAGKIILEQKVATTPEAMKQTFGKIPRSLIALETGTHSPWVSRLLTELGHEVIVAHAQKVARITKSNRKDDRRDARTLARLARIDPELWGPVRHRSAQAQIHLTVIRARAELVSARTALVNAARGLVKSFGQRLPKCGTYQVNEKLAEAVSAELRDVLVPLLREVESLSERIKEYEERMEKIATEVYPEVSLLKQVKGVGTQIALTYILTIEDPYRERRGGGFRRRGRYIFSECRGRNRIWSGRGGKRLRRGDSGGGGLPFALWLRGLDEFGVGADFAIGVLQGGEGEAIVAISLKVSFHISLLAQRTTRETKKQLNESTVEGQL